MRIVDIEPLNGLLLRRLKSTLPQCLARAFADDTAIVITDYVKHMMEESAKVFIGIAFEHTWKIYHDALTLMRAKECK